MKRIGRIVSLALIFTMSTVTLTGCGEIKYFASRASAIIEHRFDDTLNAANALKNGGLIDDDTYNKIKDNVSKLDGQLGKMADLADKEYDFWDSIGDVKSDINGVLKMDGCNLSSAVSAVRPLGGLNADQYNNKPGKDKVYGSDSSKAKAEDSLGFKVVSNYMLWQIFGIDKESANDTVGSNWIWNGNATNDAGVQSCDGIPFYHDGIYSYYTHDFKPISVVPDSVKDEIEGKFEYPVYILKPDISNSLGGDYNLDSTCNEIKSALDTKDKTKLDKYFSQAKDSKGNNVTLKGILSDNGVTIDDLIINSSFNDSKINAPGKDIVVCQGNTESDETHAAIMQIRVQEFDLTTVQKMNDALGIFNEGCRYRVVNDGDTNGRIYLVEYPVYAIDGFNITGSTSNTTTAKATYVLSGFGLNLCTGQMVNYNTDYQGNIMAGGTYLDTKDPYYTSALFGDSPANTSFACVGQSYVPLGVGGKKYKIGTQETTIAQDYQLKSTRIILKDYLETTYTPAFSSASNVNVFGRKIRFSITNFVKNGELEYNTGDNMARYVDRDGNTLSTADILKISDFCDIGKLNGDPAKVYKIVEQNKQPGKTDAVEKTASAAPAIGELAHETINTKNAKITTSCLFPGPLIGKDDYVNGTQSKQRMWAIAVDEGVYDNTLLQSWIDSDAEGASLAWWNKYLTDNGYEYQVMKDKVIEYVKKMYAVQVQECGTLIVDRGTVKDIAEIFQKEDNIARASAIRTSFIIIGWALMCLALVIVLCWAADTNTDLGLNLLGKVTFGQWTAVKYASDIPQNTNDEHSYLSFQKVVIRCIILIVVGFLLINVDIFKIVSWLVGSFGKIATTIENLIRGT
jgi:hypothetical protein